MTKSDDRKTETNSEQDAKAGGGKRQANVVKSVDHLPGVKVSGQLQGGAVDRAREREDRE